MEILNALFEKAHENPNYINQKIDITNNETTNRKKIVEDGIYEMKILNELFQDRYLQVKNAETTRIEKMIVDKKNAEIELEKKKKEDFRKFKTEKITPKLLVQNIKDRSKYELKSYEEVFGETGNVYDNIEKHGFFVYIPDISTHRYDYDDGYGCKYNIYRTPENSPFVTNLDGTYTYQLNYYNFEYSQCGKDPFTVFRYY